MGDVSASPWFADTGGLYTGQEPCYYEPAAFDWAAGLCAEWRQIHDELQTHLQAEAAGFEPYLEAGMASRPGRWKTLGLMFWGIQSKRNTRALPRTWALVRDIPGLTACSLNLLEPQTSIKPHIGNTDAIIRCHLGLTIPAVAPRCGFRVGAEIRSWTPGGLLMFCDAHEHTAWNNTDEDRYVMVIDVMREAFMARRAEICARVHAEIRLDADRKRWPWIDRLSRTRVGAACVSAAYRGGSRYRLAFGE